MTKMWKEHAAEYYAPKNFNFWYYFGSLALVVLVLQIVTGIFLTMKYKPSAADAFSSVEYIMRDVEWGWLIRYVHSTGASAFFIVVYLHMFRALLYGSHREPRGLAWILGGLLHPPLPRGARGGGMGLRLAHRSRADGRGVLRLPPAVGTDVLLGRAGDREPLRHGS